MAAINCLHLSELRLSESALSQHYLSLFYEDLEAIHRKAGPFDLVLLSGSLTDSGTDAEFERVSSFLKQLWARLSVLGSKPKLLAVPGERDLLLPNDDNPHALALTSWRDNKRVQDAFWKVPKSQLREAVVKAFAPYSRWLGQCEQLAGLSTSVGLLPGDFSATVDVNGLKLGVVGLNSSFLGFTREQGFTQAQEMELNVQQLNAVCSDDPAAWLRRQDFSLLVTAHSFSRLSVNSCRHFHEFIYPPGRFVLHLFGDQSGSVKTESISGAQARRYASVPPLFASSNAEGSFGYNALRVELNDSSCSLRCWPRVALRNESAGHTRFVPNNLNWELVDDCWHESFDLPCRVRSVESTENVPRVVFQKLMNVLGPIQEPTPIRKALCALDPLANTEQPLDELVRMLANKLLVPATVSAERIGEVALALSWLGPYLGRDRAVMLLELVTPFRWVHPNASQGLLKVTQKPPLNRVVGLNGEKLDFTGRDYVRRAQGEQLAWVRVSLSKLTEYSFDEIKDQIYECLKCRLWNCDSEQSVDEHLRALEDGSGLPVIVQVQAASTLSFDVVQRVKEHFRTITLLLFTGESEPPSFIEVLTPRLQLEQERRAFYLYAGAMTAVSGV